MFFYNAEANLGPVIYTECASASESRRMELEMGRVDFLP